MLFSEAFVMVLDSNIDIKQSVQGAHDSGSINGNFLLVIVRYLPQAVLNFANWLDYAWNTVCT